ncbi:MAG: nuclear transport factor 2 family protein [Dyadobacter fermentans]
MNRLKDFTDTDGSAQKAADLECVSAYIQHVWNEGMFELIGQYLHADYTDCSMPGQHLQNKAGLMCYLKAMSKSAAHKTEIIEMSHEEDLVCCRVRVSIREYVSNRVAVIEGYRVFKMLDNKIVGHFEQF